MAGVCLRLWVHVLPVRCRRICLVSRFKGALKPSAQAVCLSPANCSLQAVGPLNATPRAQLSSRQSNHVFRSQLSESRRLAGITSFRTDRGGTSREPDGADACECCDATALGSRQVARADSILSNMPEYFRGQS
jgi:hypothetical protein